MSQCKQAFQPEGCRRCAVFCVRNAGHDGPHYVEGAELCHDDDCPATARKPRSKPKAAAKRAKKGA